MVHLYSPIFIITITFISIYGYKSKDDGYQIDVINGTYSTNITVTVSSNRESIIHFEDSDSYFPYTVYAWSYDVDPSFPIFVMVRQQKEATSWQIPLLVESKEGTLSFHQTSRTLCHNNIDLITAMQRSNTPHLNSHDGLHKRLAMSISTAYDIPTNVTVRVEQQHDFYLKENENYSVIISPSEPRFFYYKFPDSNKNAGIRATVILEIESADETCLTVSIQQATCPVFDLNQDISYEGEYETVNTKGGIIIKETDFPNGFFIVFVAKGDNYDCDKKNSVIPSQNVQNVKPSNHSSMVIFKIRPNIAYDTFIIISLSTLAGFLVFYVIFLGIFCEFCSSNREHETTVNRNGYQNLSNVADGTISQGPVNAVVSGEINRNLEDFVDSSNRNAESTQSTTPVNMAGPSTSTVSTKVDIHSNLDSSNIIQVQDTTEMIVPYILNNTLGGSESTLYQSVRDENEVNPEECLNATETVTVIPEAPANENGEERDIYEGINPNVVSFQLHLSDLARREPNDLHKESVNYFLHVVSIGIFYGIPVVQLVITHQRRLTETGNLDLCYYNFLCANPFIGLNDYNHFMSNMGYVLLGGLFIFVTRSVHKKMPPGNDYGIPKHYGLYYAMGTALIIEGILSACYHVCPNQTNFQFDTSFMYVMAVLCIIKLYQNRHPDINATAYVTFVILAVAVLIAMAGILYGHYLIWVGFICTHMALCVYIALKIYYVNDIPSGWKLIRVTITHKGYLQALKPRKKDRYISIGTITLLNIVMANLGYLCYKHNVDFGTFLLGLLMGNAIIYSVIYVIMKFVHQERPCVQSVLYFIAAGIFWVIAAYCFVNHSTEWMVTAAESRQWNTECVLFNFYDYHDIWHILSSIALFFTFMLLLTLDNDLVDTTHDAIHVF